MKRSSIKNNKDESMELLAEHIYNQSKSIKKLKILAGTLLLSILLLGASIITILNNPPDSLVGPQGPQGPAGPAGPQGPQGPAGASAPYRTPVCIQNQYNGVITCN